MLCSSEASALRVGWGVLCQANAVWCCDMAVLRRSFSHILTSAVKLLALSLRHSCFYALSDLQVLMPAGGKAQAQGLWFMTGGSSFLICDGPWVMAAGSHHVLHRRLGFTVPSVCTAQCPYIIHTLCKLLPRCACDPHAVHAALPP